MISLKPAMNAKEALASNIFIYDIWWILIKDILITEPSDLSVKQ